MDDKNFNERCKALVESVKSLSEMENQEMFKMIYKYNSVYTKNNNGIFINLAWISVELLEKLELYVKFCNASNTEIKKYESLCDVLNNKLMQSQIPKNEKVIEKKQEVIEIEENYDDSPELLDKSGNRISSSMKFSLLKKKFSKQYNIINQNNQNELSLEDYIFT
jgi:hypothetical protein